MEPENPCAESATAALSGGFTLVATALIAEDAGDLSAFCASADVGVPTIDDFLSNSLPEYLVRSGSTGNYITSTEAATDKLACYVESCALATAAALKLVDGQEKTASARSSRITVLPSAKEILNANHSYAVSIRLVSANEMTALNREYRGKDEPTNVLSFEVLEDHEPILDALAGIMSVEGAGDHASAGTIHSAYVSELPLGDIAICVEVVCNEANSQNKSPAAHLAHMVVHAMLHLLGYDHVCEQEAGIMESAETGLLRQFGFENPYTDQHANPQTNQ